MDEHRIKRGSRDPRRKDKGEIAIIRLMEATGGGRGSPVHDMYSVNLFEFRGKAAATHQQLYVSVRNLGTRERIEEYMARRVGQIEWYH